MAVIAVVLGIVGNLWFATFVKMRVMCLAIVRTKTNVAVVALPVILPAIVIHRGALLLLLSLLLLHPPTSILNRPPPAPMAVVSDQPPPSNVNDVTEQRVDADSLADVSLSHVDDPSASSSESGSDTSGKDSIVDDNNTSVLVAPVERLSDSDVSDEEDFSSSRKRNCASDIEDFTSSVSSKVGRDECNDSAAETAVERESPFEDSNSVVSPTVEPTEMPDSNPASNVSPGAVSVTSSLLEDAQRSEVSPYVL